MRTYLVTLAIIALQWDANIEPDLVGYRLYARPSTVVTFQPMSTMGKQTSVRVKVDGRRNWYFYLTARNATMESSPGNIVYVPRGY
jgi:hypothetical protein